MNLFDQITGKSSVQGFLGNKQPETPSFMPTQQPVAPRTATYTQPVKKMSYEMPGYKESVSTSKNAPTETGLFKFVQGASDVYSGVQKRLGETAQEDTAIQQTEIDNKKKQFVSDMLQKGYKKEAIFNALDTLSAKGEFTAKPGIGASFIGGLSNRMQSLGQTTERLSNIENPLTRTIAGITPYAGQTVATALQPVTSVLEPFVSPVVQEIVKKTGQTENIQELSKGWSDFEKSNPILAENIAGLLNVSQLAPVPFAKPIGNALETGAKTVARPIVAGAKKIAPGIVKGVKGTQSSIASASDAIQTGINRMTKGEINKFQAEQGVSPGKYLNDRGIVDSGKPIEETLLSQMKTSRDQATAGIDAIQGNYKMPSRKFGDAKIDYLREMLSDNYNKALKTLDAEGTTKAKQLLDKYDSEGLSMTEINQSKRKMAENNPVNWLTDSASDRVQTVKKISDEVRNWQFQQAEKAGFTNLKEINKQTQAFYKLHEGITKWNDGIEANNKISLTDYLAFDADPSVFVAKKVLSSPFIRQGIVKGLNKLSGRVVKPTEKATIGTINTKRAEYDFGNRTTDIGDRVDTRKQLALPAPTGKATGAKNVRVNQPKDTSKVIIEKVNTEKVKRPTTAGITESEAVKMKKAKDRADTIKSLKETIASNTKAAQKGGTGNTRIETGIEQAILQKKITRDEAKDILMDIFDDVSSYKPKFLYVDKKKLENYINDFFKGKKIEDFDEMVKAPVTPVKEVTPKKITPTEKVNSTQANGPTVIGKMGKVGKKTTPQSPTAYEQGMRRPYTLQANKPIVKRASDIDIGSKSKQLEFIKKNNPMTDDYHTGIREVKDIKTFKETLSDPESLVYPDFTREMAENAIKEGKIRVYSSKNLDNPKAQFITPSKMQAKDYAGNKEIYSKIVDIDEVAWINADEGQLVGKIKSPVKNPLVEEARKYKSAEEFVKAKENSGDIVYHGTKTNFDSFSKEKLGLNTGASSAKEGFFFTDSKQNANHYTKTDINADAIIGKIAKNDNLLLSTNYGVKRFGYTNPIDALYSGGKKELTKSEILKKVSEDFDIEINKSIGEISMYPKFLQKGILDRLDSIKNSKKELLDLWEKGLEDNTKVGANIKKVLLKYKKPFVTTENHVNKSGGQFTKLTGDNGEKFTSYTDAIKYAKENGYDAVKINGANDPLPGNTVVVFNENQILTESQLRKIYEESKK